ncbi:MAG: TadE family protein [Anaerolineae bacterium]
MSTEQRLPLGRRVRQPGRAGQSLVEMALVLPLLLLLVFGIIEFGRVFNAYIIVTNAAREGARCGAVGCDEGEITTEIMQTMASLGNPTLIDVEGELGGRGSPVVVTIRYDLPIIAPLMPVILGESFTVTGSARMRME